MFDDMETFEGWNYIADKIFELPRNQKFVKVLEQRFTEAELIQKKKNRAKFKKRGISFKGGSKLNLNTVVHQTAGSSIQLTDNNSRNGTVSPRDFSSNFVIQKEKPQLKQLSPNKQMTTIDEKGGLKSPGIKKNFANSPPKSLNFNFQPTDKVPSFVKNSPRWQKLHALEKDIE